MVDTRGQRSLVTQRQAPLRALYATDPEEALTYKWARTSSADLAPWTTPFTRMWRWGVDPHAQVGFTGFWSTVRLQPAPDTPPRLIDKLIETTKRVCVNLDTLQRPNPIELIVDSASAC